MKGTEQRRSQCLPRIRLGALIGIVALGVLLIPTLIAGRPGQAPQTGPTYRVLHAFTEADGGWPLAAMILDPTRKLLVGTAYMGTYRGVVFGVNPATGQETVLHTFTGGADGAEPSAGLIVDPAGNLYGTTWDGGSYGEGVVFELSPTDQETVLYSFTGGEDGANPNAALVRDSAGNLYGMTVHGGNGSGVVFKLSPTGQETVFHSFTGGVDGESPFAGLIRDALGNLYGTTESGGHYGAGLVFRLSPTAYETALYSFTGETDGQECLAGVIRDSSGNLYGTTNNGGNMSGCYGYGCGVVFKLSRTGQETVLYSFTGGADGAYPYFAGVVRDSSGNLYGTAYAGGAYGDGVVYELSATGQETVLHNFAGRDGSTPHTGLVRDSAGNLYGTTYYGDDMNGCYGYGCGVVFKITP